MPRIKKKFALAIISLAFGYAVVIFMLFRIETHTITDLASLLGALATYTLAVLAPIYAADVADKKFNDGKY